MFRRLAPQGGTPREVSEVVNGVLNGKINSTGYITLDTGGATSTTLFDERISPESKIILVPNSAASLADSAPFGEFGNMSGQFAPSAGTTAVVEWDATLFANGCSISDTSRINVFNEGTYSALFILQLQNTNNDIQYADIWLRVNGSDVADSGRRFFIPARKSSTEPAHALGALGSFLELDANDYIEVAGVVTSTDVNLETFPADASVPRPAIPAATAKIEYIAPKAYSNIYATNQTFGQATIEHWANSAADKTYGYVVLG